MKKFLTILLAAVAFFIINSNIVYSDSSSYSELNMLWNQFTIQGGTLGNDYVIRWTYYGTHCWSGANDDSLSDQQNKTSFDPSIPATITSNVGVSTGSAFVSKDISTSKATANAYGINTTFNSWSSGNAHFRWDLTILNDLMLTFSVPYNYKHILSAQFADEGARAYSRPSFYADEYLPTGGGFLRAGEDFEEMNHTLNGVGNNTYSGTDVLTFTAMFYKEGNDHTGWYWFEGHGHTSGSAYSNHQGIAPVPEPATMLLIGSGLIGLAGVRKRFKKKA